MVATSTTAADDDRARFAPYSAYNRHMADAEVSQHQQHQHGQRDAHVQAPATTPAGAGLAAVEAVRGDGALAVHQIAGIVAKHPEERGAIFTWLHAHRGNTFVSQVMADPGLGDGGKITDGVELKRMTASITIPGNRKLEGNWSHAVSTRSATQVTLEVSATGVKIWFAPTMFVDATWPLQNAELYGAGYSFASGKASCDVADGHGVGSGLVSIKDRVGATIVGLVEGGVAGTALAKPGYNPMTDPNVSSTLEGFLDHFQHAFPAGDSKPAVAPREMSNVAASATVTTKGASFVKDGTGLQLAAGSELTLGAQGSGTLGDLLGKTAPGDLAAAANIQRITLDAAGLTVVSKGKPLVKIESLSLAPGGAVTIDRMTLLGKAADYQAGESGISLLVGLLALAAHDGRTANDALEHAQNPTIVPGITKAMLEKQFTETVHDLLLEHRHDVPGMDLATILKIGA